MGNAQTSMVDDAQYELHFTDLFDRGRGYVFPCDAHGRVDMEHLAQKVLVNYLFARALVGRQLSLPEVVRVD